ncbi:MAG: Gfo/Idh/MocA family oxidoreductase, partial [Planctomycetes bacterium]|nr:Gfo/Idh/MocA family oxidoreductase [Planctomycetota bacterium]
ADAVADAAAGVIRVGMIGLDTSHVIAFTQLLNDEKSPDYVPGARVVAGYPGGSPDNATSASRIAEYTKQLREQYGVEIVPDIPTLLSKVDAVLLESVDGRPHLREARPVIAAKKPLYIDKPLAASLEDALEIARLAKEAGVPCFSASSLRFFPGVARLKGSSEVGDILGCDAFSPCPTEEHHPDLYWYGVHGVEILFTLMGTGCESVTRVSSPDFDVVVGRWKDGRIGTFRGTRKGAHTYGATAFGSKGVKASDPVSGNLYKPLVEEIVRFFATGKAPVALDDTLELFAFMTAADASKARGGQPVQLSEVLARARGTGAGPSGGGAGAGAGGGGDRHESRERVAARVAAGEIPAIEVARFLADAAGLPLIYEGTDRAIAERSVLVPAPIDSAGRDMAKRLLEAAGFRLSEMVQADGQRVLLLEAADLATPPVEPRERPVVSVGGGDRPRDAVRTVRETRAARAARGLEAESTRYAGLVLEEAPEVLRAQLGLELARGVLVADVDEGALAAGADLPALKRFDVVTHVDATPVSDGRGFVDALNRRKPGAPCEVRVVRKGTVTILRASRESSWSPSSS